MSRSPRRPGARVLAPLFVLGLATLLPPGGGPSQAGQVGGALQGQIPKSPPFLDGFPIPFHRTTDYRPQEGALLASDLDGDGGLELVVSIPAGLVTVIHRGGIPALGWPRTFDHLPQPAYPFGAPGLGDLDGDRSPEIVTCVISGEMSRRTFLYAFHADGTDVDGWPVEVGSSGTDYYSCSPSAVLLADLDGDRRMEVVRAMSHGELLALDGRGRPVLGWPVRLRPDGPGPSKEVNADLAAADLDGDGRDEVVFVEAGVSPRLVAVSGDGRIVSGFPISLSEVTNRQAPAVADLDGDGLPELAQSTMPVSCSAQDGSTECEPQPTEPLVQAVMHVVHADGSTAPGWPRPLSSGGAWGAVPVDLDGDGLPEILQDDGDALLAFDAVGALLSGFPRPIHRDFIRAQALRVSPWVVGDVDGDAIPDFVQARTNIYNGSAYLRLIGLRASGQPLKGFPFDAEGLVAASRPVLADLSSDGTVDLALLTGDGTNGGWILVVWNLGALRPGSQ